jgi:phage-related protein
MHLDKTQPQKIPLAFYKSERGSEPVREWLKGLAKDERHAIGRDLLRAQWRWPVGMPLCRPMRGGLWEIRSHLRDGKTARVMICISAGRLVALHGFIKKTQTTPQSDLAIGRRRLKELQNA